MVIERVGFVNNTLEQKILAFILNEPEKAKRLEIKPNWFADKSHRELAYTLLNTDTNFKDFSAVEMELKQLYPKSVITEEWLHAVKFEGIYVDDIKQSVKTLQTVHVKRMTHRASVQYTDYPSEENREKLEDWFRTMSELDIKEDEGELRQPTEQLLHELENDVEDGVMTYKKLDSILGAGLEGGMLFVLAGRPGTGKTAYAINLAIRGLIRNDDMLIDFFSLEMSKLELLKRIVSQLTEINSYKFKNANRSLTNEEKVAVIDKAAWVNQMNLRIHDDKFNLSSIERTIRQRHYEAGDNKYMAVVDYVGLVDAEDGRLQRNQQVGKISRMMKRLTGELNIPIVLLSQLNRGVESRDSNIPVLADLRESGDLEQDANVVGFLYLDDPETYSSAQSQVCLKIAKNRGGGLMTIDYEFDKPHTNFKEF